MPYVSMISLLSLLIVLFAPTHLNAQDFLKQNDQMLLVTTPDWDSVSGTLRRFVRSGSDSPWRQVGSEISAVVGRSGLGWGLGLHPTNDLSGPMKREGDGKSPAGAFMLSSAFGLGTHASLKFIKLPYQQLVTPIECVDDTNSVHYNQIVSRDQVKQVDWNSSEKMREVGEQYRLGVVVNHNADPRSTGSGSCIFLHIWKNDKTGTSGCTAMSSGNIEDLLHWLDPAKKPVLVQLPEAQYRKLQRAWRLP